LRLPVTAGKKYQLVWRAGNGLRTAGRNAVFAALNLATAGRCAVRV